MRCAVINESNGYVENIIEADPENDPAPAGFFLVGLRQDSRVDGGGWIYDAVAQKFSLTETTE